MRFTPVLRNITKTIKPPQASTFFGLDAHPNPRPALISLYRRILNNVSALPSDAIYRKSVESITQQRLKIAESETELDRIVEKIDCGVMEELIWQAQDELKLVAKMAELKPWLPLEEAPVPGQWDSVKV
ncbi:hypothetical protein DFJ73DRAFT_846464 [Zopfochytrium polystomum]|nr:hypothetical protein DFJ73DRAFT_846464 [Zopfochytrium polystomum]